jgi:hypothetical protein
MRDLIARVADDLGLTDAERAEQIPSGGTTVIASRSRVLTRHGGSGC